MQLLKLVYLCHGWMLAVYNKRLIMDRIEAWQYGPVIPQLYHLYKVFGADNIEGKGIDHSDDLEDNSYKELIETVLKIYKNHSAVQLSSMTHTDGSPWDVTVRKYGIGAVIDNELIRQYYTNYIMEHFVKS